MTALTFFSNRNEAQLRKGKRVSSGMSTHLWVVHRKEPNSMDWLLRWTRKKVLCEREKKRRQFGVSSAGRTVVRGGIWARFSSSSPARGARKVEIVYFASLDSELDQGGH